MKLFIITGQTATGKTELAIDLAQKEHGELINCDSRQIYKYLDIISGKDLTSNDYTEEKKLGNFSIGYYKIGSKKKKGGSSFPIWLYDMITPKDSFSSFDYEQCALKVIQDTLNKGKIPIIVGGTYFYLKHLLYDLVTTQTPPNWELRKSLEGKSINELQESLITINKPLFESLNESDKKNPHRLIRKIEISTHETNFQHKEEEYNYTLSAKLGKEVEIEYIGLRYKDRDTEYRLIKERVDKRLEEGAIEEVEDILKKGFSPDDPGMNTIGYQQIIEYIKGRCTKDEALEKWLTKEIQYAKRQFTFIKKDPNIIWREV